MKTINSIGKTASLALLLTSIGTIGSMAPPLVIANSNLDQCSYRDATVNDGWGYNAVTGESCAPLPFNDQPTNGTCSYAYAEQNQGWGYDQTTGLSCPPLVSDDSISANPGATPGAMAGNRIVVQFRGTGTAQPRSFDTTGDGVSDTTAPCFDAPIFNLETGLQIGTGSDCLDVISDDDGNIQLTGYGFFTLDSGDTLVVRGDTTVRPVLQPTTSGGIDFTHITGANGDNGVLYGTGRFLGASGAVRLSGQVDMSRLSTDNQIFFDCIFVVAFN